MTAESASYRQHQWALVLRRSFGIPDLVDDDGARQALIASFQNQLQETGWQGPTRAIAEPLVTALMALEASGDLDDRLLPAGLGASGDAPITPDAASRLIDRGMTVVDPEHLVFDVMGNYPTEVVVVAQQVLDRVCQHVREQPFS